MTNTARYNVFLKKNFKVWGPITVAYVKILRQRRNIICSVTARSLVGFPLGRSWQKKSGGNGVVAITSALHAEGPGFKPRFLQIMNMLPPWLTGGIACSFFFVFSCCDVVERRQTVNIFIVLWRSWCNFCGRRDSVLGGTQS